jgi:uncharacterized protein (DUF952 family)
MPFIYHVTELASWEAAKKAGFYKTPSLDAEGFIHCSHEHQVQGVIERYFQQKESLVTLVIDTELLQSNLVYEWSPSTADTFPHVYGVINSNAVIEVQQVNKKHG